MCYIALAHLKDGKNFTEVVDALRVTRHSVMRWLKWFACGGVNRLAGTPHYWSTQRLPKTQEEAFRQAVEQLQDNRGGGRVRGEDIRQLLSERFAVAYSFNGVYDRRQQFDHINALRAGFNLSVKPVDPAKLAAVLANIQKV